MKIQKFRYEINRLLEFAMFKFYPIIAILLFLSGCGWGERWFEKTKEVNNYEKVALNLAKENRLLKLRINNLENKIHTLKLQNKYASILAKIGPNRRISSVEDEIDLVRFKEYNWTAEELLFVAEIEYERNDYEKAAQFYFALIKNYPKYQKINDRVIYNTALSSFESGHYNWSQQSFKILIKEYPNSKFYLSAKLWKALTLYKLGKKKKFRSKIKEFKELYRNTPEWRILSKHYERIKKN
ncbi:MAG: tetratricopeptide repeat protein [Deltaproteobacteria bacterium]|nr:MAG: tetratricopeptide repeat protein [Deltaproteobacteria bacterium]